MKFTNEKTSHLNANYFEKYLNSVFKCFFVLFHVFVNNNSLHSISKILYKHFGWDSN